MIVSLTDYIPEARYDGLPWTHARIEEAAAAGGPWTAIDTKTLAPVDADPSAPLTRSFTTTLATLYAGWYRIVWTDAALQESATPPVRNTMPFATADDLGHRLGLVLTADEKARAAQLLAAASGLIQTETSQTITQVVNDTLIRRSSYDERIRLPERPVTSVASVTIDAALQDAASWYLDGDELVRARWPVGENAFFLGSFGRGWLGPWHTITVVYTHGYAAIPDIVKAVCLEAVVRVWVNPGSVFEERFGDTATIYTQRTGGGGGLGGLLLTDEEREQVNSIIRRTENSTVLR